MLHAEMLCGGRLTHSVVPPTMAPISELVLQTEVVDMEECMLKVLDFRLTAPTVKTFLRRFLQVT